MEAINRPVAGESGDRGRMLEGLRVIMLTSGHEAMDSRIYGRLALSLKQMGADMKIIGRGQPGIKAGVEIIALRGSGSRLTRFFVRPWKCLFAINGLDPDIIHLHDAELLMILPFLKLFKPNARLVYDVHEDFAKLLLIREWLPERVRKAAGAALDILEKRLALLADGIVAVTQPLADKFPNHNRIAAYNFVSDEFFRRAGAWSKKPEERKFDLVHLGTLSHERAVFLAKTISEFHRMKKGANSLLIGVSGELAGRIRPLLPENCTLLGRIGHEEIPKLLGDSKVGIDVHPWRKPHLEVALPVKVCEYMASECAVVASHMPVLEKMAGRHLSGLKIIKGGDPMEYARAVSLLLERTDSGEGPGAGLREFALKYMKWEQEALKVAELYLRLKGARK